MAPRRSVVKGSGEVVIVQLTPKMREVYYIFVTKIHGYKWIFYRFVRMDKYDW